MDYNYDLASWETLLHGQVNLFGMTLFPSCIMQVLGWVGFGQLPNIEGTILIPESYFGCAKNLVPRLSQSQVIN